MMLNELLRIYRKHNNLTQEQLATKLLVSHQSVSKWERGVNIPSLDNLILLSDLYNVSLDELIRGSAYFKKPFFVGRKINLKKMILSLVGWTFCCLLFTGFGYQPAWLFLLVFIIGVMIVLPVFFEDYWLIDTRSLKIQKYSSCGIKVVELAKTLTHRGNDTEINYSSIKEVTLIYIKKTRLSPFDIGPDTFYLAVKLIDNEIIHLPLTNNGNSLVEILPQFFSFLQKKQIKTYDPNAIIPIIIEKGSIYTYMNQKS